MTTLAQLKSLSEELTNRGHPDSIPSTAHVQFMREYVPALIKIAEAAKKEYDRGGCYDYEIVREELRRSLAALEHGAEDE